MCFFALLASGCSRKSHVATIKAQGGYEVRISADRFYENQRSFYCELWLNGRQLKPIHFFEASEETKYEVVEATNKIGFKIIDSPTHETLIMVNRKTGESWPWTSDTDTIQDTHARKVKLDSLFTKAEQGVAPKNR
jgi:hypothetical protein